MNVWYNHPTIFKQRRVLRIAGLLSLCVALTTTLLFTNVSRATAGINSTLSFQGRLQTATGSIVPDGYYNIQFKIYQDGDGQQAGDTGGSGGALKWTETYINNGGNNGVQVKNGYFSVNLGSLNPFGTSVDWNQDTLWLSMNIGGSATNCTTFNSGSCAADGEMLPMKRLTSTPYAINSGELGGKKADNFVQLAQGVQTDASTNTSSIFINKTGSGNLVQLQNTATDVVTIDNTGDLTLGNNADHTIAIATGGASAAGNNLTVSAGTGGSGGGSAGGNLVLQGGAAGGTTAGGGNIIIDAGAGTGGGADGAINIGTSHAGSIQIGSTGGALTQNVNIGNNNTGGSTTNVTIGSGGSAAGGTTTIQSKGDTTVSTNGTQKARFSSSSNTLYVGNANSSGQAGTANSFVIQGTSSTTNNVQGGSLTLQSGSATSGSANGGNLNLFAGSGVGSGATGLVVINTPTFQTASNDTNCYTSGALVASSCTFAGGSVNSSSVLVTGFSTAGQVATLPDPAIVTAGRIIYVTAANGSKEFTLRANSGAGAGIERNISMRQNTTATLIWNGSDWTSADTTNDATLFSVHNDNNGDHIPVVKIGSGTGSGTPTLLNLDSATSAPTVTDSALLGSMYYDSTLGEVQCYEADGWGACAASPDSFVTMSPEYANAVTHGDGIGTLTSDLCSNTLNINDGSSSQPTICGTNETYNFYAWTSSENTNQTKSIFVTYQLPANFKNFVSGATSLMGRTDSSDAHVAYQIYRNSSGGGLIACGSSVSVSTGSQSSWQKGTASGSADPSSCSFAAGDSIVFKIDLTAENGAHAYVSNLNFAFSNNRQP